MPEDLPARAPIGPRGPGDLAGRAAALVAEFGDAAVVAVIARHEAPATIGREADDPDSEAGRRPVAAPGAMPGRKPRSADDDLDQPASPEGHPPRRHVPYRIRSDGRLSSDVGDAR